MDFKIKKNIKKIGSRLLNFLVLLAEHDFWVCLFLFIVASLAGGIIFYNYYLAQKSIQAEGADKSYSIESGTMDKISKIWEENTEKFEGAKIKEYPNIFR